MPMHKEFYNEDRFYVNLNQDNISWIYHNPDAISGDQFVTNIFDMDLLKDALKKYPPSPENDFGPGTAFDYIAENCRQYCTDIGDYAYEGVKEQFENTPDGIGCTNGTVETIELLFKAKELIDMYCMEEFGSPGDYYDLSKIGIGYTTNEKGDIEIGAYTNLKDYRTEIYYNGKFIAKNQAECLKDYVDNQLTRLDFYELTDIPDWVLEEFNQTGIHNPDLQFMHTDTMFASYDLCIEVGSYMYGGGLYLALYDLNEDGLEPFADLTVNLPEYPTKENCAFVDENNFGQGPNLIKQFHLGEPTGRIGKSGYCTYREYRFDMDEIKKYCMNPNEIKSTEKSKNDRSDER